MKGEDTAFLFAEMGVETGVDLPTLLETARRFQGILPDIPLTSALSPAGWTSPAPPEVRHSAALQI